MKPEKMEALLLKLRKGKPGTAVSAKELQAVFDLLGGYKVEAGLGWKPGYVRSNGAPGTTTVKVHYADTLWAEAKKDDIKGRPTVPPNAKFQTVYSDVGPLKTDPDGKTSFDAVEWEARPQLRVTAPNGKVWIGQAMNPHDDPFKEAEVYKLYPWLVKETDFIAQINNQLGMDTVEVEKERAEKARKKQVIEEGTAGTCPYCFGLFKLTPRTKEGKDPSMPGMVIHGYKRPGDGVVVGRCPGHDWPPFELSPEGTHVLLNDLHKAVEKARDSLKFLKDSPLIVNDDYSATFYTFEGSGKETLTSQEIEHDRLMLERFPRKHTPKKVVVLTLPKWKEYISKKIEHGEGVLKESISEEARIEKVLANWKPEQLGPLGTR